MSDIRELMNERSQYLLKTLIERYIRDGQPVGSRTLAKETEIALSSATIRNVMADLEDLGLIHAPHTSAGRVPTVQGYRLFVDSLLTIRPPDEQELQSLQSRMDPDTEPQDIIRRVSNMLSELTSMVGVVMVPRRERESLRQIEFLPLSEKRVLVILVLNDQEVQNRVIHTTRDYSASELQEVANYLNSIFAGRSLNEVREALIRDMQADHDSMNRLMRHTLEMAGQLFQEESDRKDDYVLAGHTNLMSYDEMHDVQRLRGLFEAFNQKRDILHILDHSMAADSVQIFIGEESGRHVLDDCSVITSPYRMGEQVAGVLGVIGPKRMAYDRVIPLVDVTARLLGAALTPTKK